MRQALAGVYHPKNFTLFEWDFAVLMYELGGKGVTHALHNAPYALPARSSLTPVRRKTPIVASSGSDIQIAEVLANMRSVFTADRVPSRRLLHTFCVDEIAIERRPSYNTSTDEILGLCREHVGCLSSTKVGETLASAREAAKAVKDDRVHLGKEATVGAIAGDSRNDYGAKPILVSPTCKRSTWQDSALIQLTTVLCWLLSAVGETLQGPLASFSSDGDQLRRMAMYFVCMRFIIEAGDPLYVIVGSLIGLNLYVGPLFITMDFDWKHLLKRAFNCALLFSCVSDTCT